MTEILNNEMLSSPSFFRVYESDNLLERSSIIKMLITIDEAVRFYHCVDCFATFFDCANRQGMDLFIRPGSHKEISRIILDFKDAYQTMSFQ